jgi:hypothetical protein
VVTKVVLNEHFRCSPEIISFSNENFYNEGLVPMRLPTKSERISPSIVDVRVPNGKKNGMLKMSFPNQMMIIPEVLESSP